MAVTTFTPSRCSFRFQPHSCSQRDLEALLPESLQGLRQIRLAPCCLPIHGHLGFCFLYSAKAVTAPLFTFPFAEFHCVLSSCLCLSLFLSFHSGFAGAGTTHRAYSCRLHDLLAHLRAGGPCFCSPAQLSPWSLDPCIQLCPGTVPRGSAGPLNAAYLQLNSSSRLHNCSSPVSCRSECPHRSQVLQGPGPSACHRESQPSRSVSFTS